MLKEKKRLHLAVLVGAEFSTTHCAVLEGVQDIQARVVIAAAEQCMQYTLQKALSIVSQTLTMYAMFVVAGL